MIDEKTSPHDFETTCQRLTDAVPANGFGLLHTHDIHGTLNAKGVDFAPQCRVFEVCNPKRAAEVLAVRMDLANALPCRIAVYERDGEVIVSMIRPTEMLATLSDDAKLAEVAGDVEQTMGRMIEETIGH
ncbi:MULTISPECIES: DUF302 domain-containing protein [unclassified Guyparkeria]|uniref:DUF302 domain-containing protein n=1 Tax=unclassified Guyparkeria TaxID=2626246 RepID=UPI000733931B|nr:MULTISPECIES: DUF302 domain-containing protein [unclassified Guyparkeria]KTG17201.1 hypothetical protein AUR63_10095 [Guyparkeria sp. XI15]OAE87171.1 hypothetical protein AWR35_10110 [Guyparkeria sp. WRN-7]